MAIEIIVEDGTLVSNANSYVSIANARLYAANRGILFPSIDDDLAAMLIKATDYLEAQWNLYQGERTYEDQTLQWPRTNVYIYGNLLPSSVIPKSLISAQVELAIAINSGLDLQPNITPESYVIKEKTGPIETVYESPLKTGITPTFSAVNSLLSLLFKPNSLGLHFKTIRV